MPLQIVKSALQSRSARQSITRGAQRFIDLFPATGEEDDGNIITRVFNPVARVAGWLWGVLGWVSIRVTDIFGWLIGGVTRLSTFDWNATDEKYRQLQSNQNLTMAAVWGSFAGQGLGWLAGIGVGYGVGLLCPVIGGSQLARYIASSVLDEATAELTLGLRSALVQTAESLGNNLLLSAYMQYRNLLKNAPERVLRRVYGEDTAGFIRHQWGREGQPTMTFAGFIEEQVESIDNDILRVFVENMLEEGWDSFVEAGFIIAYELDNAFSQTRASSNAALGKERAVILTPDVRTDEKIVITGKEELAKQAITNTMNTFTLVHNRDVGNIVGMTEKEYLKAQPLRRKAHFIFRHRPSPPWKDDEGQIRDFSYAVPDLKAGISWLELKTAARPFLWGEYRATANLDNGRQMAVYGGSPNEAENALLRLLTLSTADIVTLNVAQEKIRHPSLKKHATLIYPAYVHLLVRRPSVDPTDRTDLNGGTFSQEKQRVLLWPDEEPDDFVPFY